jgi:tetratricopeptide (TPR) repeat protein
MFKKCLFLILLTLPLLAIGQDQRLAQNYMEQGEYEKALDIYQKIYKQNPRNLRELYNLIDVHHELQNYKSVDSLLDNAEQLMPRNKELLVERGYNLALQKQDAAAEAKYTKAIEFIDSIPRYTSTIASRFQARSLLDEAVKAYEKGKDLLPETNFDYQLSRLYGEQGDFEKFFETTVSIIEQNASYRAQAQAIFSQYITDDSSNERNQLLRKVLLLRWRQSPDILYNQLLSWLFVQQKDFRQAFVQEKAIYKRTQESMRDLQSLAVDAVDSQDIPAALEILDYMIAEAPAANIKYGAQVIKARIMAEHSAVDEYLTVDQFYQEILSTYGTQSQTYAAQLEYADFLAFKYDQPEKATEMLLALEKLSLSPIQKARVKMLLADILVLQEQFNRALILYSQVQNDVPNDELAQEAQFKVARTSFFQGDFKWSLTQLKVLRAAASKLIANDAMELSLVISDHSIEDTTMVALSAFAKARFSQYQNKNKEAIDLYQQLLMDHKGDPIEDETLFEQGRIHEELGEYDQAAKNFQIVIDNYSDGILADDALYHLGLLYEENLGEPEKAKTYYEQIIFSHADSIHLVDARRRFRRLRGDGV